MVEKMPVNRFEILKYLAQIFWDDFKKEMFLQSYRRNKWQKPTENLKVGQLILIKSTLEPKRFYKRGRIIQVHKGTDKIVRHATFRLANGKTNKLHVKDLILLPFEEESSINNSKSHREDLIDVGETSSSQVFIKNGQISSNIAENTNTILDSSQAKMEEIRFEGLNPETLNTTFESLSQDEINEI